MFYIETSCGPEEAGFQLRQIPSLVCLWTGPWWHNGRVDDLFVNALVTIPAQELRISFARSGGPGGQNVNKVESKVEIRWRPAASTALSGLPPQDREWVLGRLASRLTVAGDLVVTSSRTRDQLKNRQDVRSKLAEIVHRALQRPKRRQKTRPSRSAVDKRIRQKKERSEIKRERRNLNS